MDPPAKLAYRAACHPSAFVPAARSCLDFHGKLVLHHFNTAVFSANAEFQNPPDGSVNYACLTAVYGLLASLVQWVEGEDVSAGKHIPR